MARKIVSKVMQNNRGILINTSFIKKLKNVLKEKPYYSINEFFEDELIIS